MGLETMVKEAEKQGKGEKVVKTAGRGGPPVAPPRDINNPPPKQTCLNPSVDSR
jgi:hypothetical protein